MHPKQLPLFPPNNTPIFNFPFPSTRYQGSKRKLIHWIWENVHALEFETVLDVFGGTGAVSHMFKNAGKRVTYNDILAFNHNIGLALIENYDQKLSEEEIELILAVQVGIDYPNFIQKNFPDIYFTEDENAWLDRVVYNINYLLENPYKQALARFALFQACIIKRPYNLFHRANLYIRTAEVNRSFGNKTTWDTPFEIHFRNFIDEAKCAIFDNAQKNKAIQYDAVDTPTGFDLVYIDPPYLNKKGIGVDYRDFYHFLEGIINYESWGEQIDYNSKHRRLKPKKLDWNNPSKIAEAFETLIEHHRNSILVVSYRDDGIPTKKQLMQMLLKYKELVHEATQPVQYALAHRKTHELLLIAK
jgi:adenine-specific DNA-methyltransferase